MHLELCEIGVGLASHVAMYPGCAACVTNQRMNRGHGHRRCNAKDNAPPRAATYGAVYPETRREASYA
jgi:hypothetical protein